MKLWEVATGRLVGTLADAGSWVESVGFSAEGRLRASASYYHGRVCLWDVGSGKRVCCRAFDSAVLAVSFDPRRPERLLAAEAGEVGVPRIWEFTIMGLD